MKRILLLSFISATFTMQAQKPQLSFRARGLLDGTVTNYGLDQKTRFLYKVEDLRLGFKATMGASQILVDVGIAGNNKVAIKDLTYTYQWKRNMFIVGNAYEPFSLEMLNSTLDMPFHQAASSSLAFGDGRKIGLTYHHYNPNVYVATGVYANNDINTLSAESLKGLISTSRLVLREMRAQNRLFHIGAAFSYRTREEKIWGEKTSRILSSPGVTGLLGGDVVYVELEDVGSEMKLGMELLATLPRVRFQTEYHLNWHNFKDNSPVYKPHGGYAQMGLLLLGRGYGYDASFAVPTRPVSSRAIELTTRYNYVTLNHKASGVMGGEHQDVSLGLNYYINNYFAVKINASYMIVGEYAKSYYPKNLLIGQLRLQFTL